MILAFAGRRAQSINGDLDAVGLRVRRLLSAIAPTAIVGAMSDGGDLLVIEAALAMADGPDIHVILPTPEEVFREHSVAPDWRDRFDRSLEQVRRRGTVSSLGLDDGSEAYRCGSVAFLDRASELATGDARPVALVIAREGEGAIVEDFVDRARLRSIPVLRIDPEVQVTTRPRVFVAMPYGTKQDPQRRFEVNCDLVYQKILLPALEDAQLYYRRADEEIDAGVVLEPMIQWLAEADLVIGDLQTGNFNVGWELGLRHLMRARHTLIVGPLGTAAPFDLSMIRHVGYRQDERGVTDEAAIAAWSALAPYLRGVDQPDERSDSPVAAVMEVAQWGVVRRRTVPDPRWDGLRQQLALARDIGDADLMLEVLGGAADLDPTALAVLRAEGGVGLVRLGHYDEAKHLLGDIVQRDPEVNRPDAHVYYAQSLYRPAEADIDTYDAAERVLRRVLIKRPEHPEVRAMLGAIAKRRARLRQNAAEREPDLRLAMDAYSHDYERRLNAYYEGINFAAMAVALHFGYDDESAGQRARELLPAVRLAAQLALRAAPDDYWAAASLAECSLYESMMTDVDETFTAAYRAAGAMRPRRGDLDATLFQLDFLRTLGLPEQPIAEAREALLAGAGVRDPAHA